MKDGKAIATIGIIGLGIWAFTKRKEPVKPEITPAIIEEITPAIIEEQLAALKAQMEEAAAAQKAQIEKAAAAEQEQLQAEITALEAQITKLTKQPVAEGPNLSLNEWQNLTSEQLKTFPVQTNVWKDIGVGKYNPAVKEVPIGDTGFVIRGVTDYGATIISTKPVDQYDPWEWMM